MNYITNHMSFDIQGLVFDIKIKILSSPKKLLDSVHTHADLCDVKIEGLTQEKVCVIDSYNIPSIEDIEKVCILNNHIKTQLKYLKVLCDKKELISKTCIFTLLPIFEKLNILLRIGYLKKRIDLCEDIDKISKRITINKIHKKNKNQYIIH